MTTKKRELTKEELAQLEVFKEECFKKAIDPKRIDRNELLPVLEEVYSLLGYALPPVYIYDSPKQAMEKIRDHLPEDHPDKTGYNGSYLWGFQDMYWISFYKFAETLGVEYPPELSQKLDLMYRMALQTDWWWVYDKACFVSQKPLYIKYDDQDRLHSETGPAIEYADGFSIYSWHGTTVPEEWIKDKSSITPDVIFKWGNAEQRRCACEILGWVKVLPLLNAKLIDKDPNPQYGELYEVKHEALGGEKELFLKVQCGTGRTFAIPVTNFKKRTAKEANAATYGWTEKEPIENYLPVIRT